MRRLIVALSCSVLVACASAITRSNPPEMPEASATYAGRVTLRAPMMVTRVDAFAHTWHKRLSLLDVAATVTFDNDRAVFDLFDLPREHERLRIAAEALADRGGYALETAGGAVQLAAAEATHRKPPREGCDCGGILRMGLPTSAGIAPGAATRTYAILRNGVRTGQTVQLLGAEASEEANGTVAEFALPSNEPELTRMAVILAGGTLPGATAIQSIAPARSAR